MSELVYIIEAGGVVMYPLLLIGIIAGAVILERLIIFSRIGRIDRALLKKVSVLCGKGEYDLAIETLQGISGPHSASLIAIIHNRNKSISAMERVVQEIGEEYFVRLERRLSYLDTATTISPLLGLLGTILGMIGSFKAMSTHTDIGNNDLILHGVAEALYATAAGISIAVVCFIAYNYFVARLKHITSETEIAATRLINEITPI